MHLKSLELVGFKSFGKKSQLEFSSPITAIVGPNGSGKSNTAEAFRFVLGEQSMKSLRGKRGEDLVWGGSGEVPRANRASVKLVLDNSDRLLHVDFDEVVIERVVYRDGTNEYSINNSKVRLKDINELLSSANVGSSGHHIISQGEADRVLAASPRERRQMIEDALGLRVYQYKKDESQKKLEKTRENTAHVEALRRENQPHLKFLERQVRKLEKARELRTELIEAYHTYLWHEERYLGMQREVINGARDTPRQALRTVEDRIQGIRTQLEREKKDDTVSHEILDLEKSIGALREELAAKARAVGRIEGQIAAEEYRLSEEEKRARQQDGQPIPYREVRALWEELTLLLDGAQGKNGEYLDSLSRAVHDAQHCIRKFIERHQVRADDTYVPDMHVVDQLRTQTNELESDIENCKRQLAEKERQVRELQETANRTKDESRTLERELFTLMATQTEHRAELARLDTLATALKREEEEYAREISEGVVLVGKEITAYRDAREIHVEDQNIDATTQENRSTQYERKRELEKLKIRLEEMGGASADEIMKEYTEVQERDAFLARELTDLTESARSLEKLIADLEQELTDRFTRGVADISKQFSAFFTLMFGGGSANLKIVSTRKRKSIVSLIMGETEDSADTDETDGQDAAGEDGVDVEVSLPKKRVQSLLMLSGGERTLTSIALIFAMSQVNPPPFLILDETDAALDEANSRRYGDMIVNLSEKSQLILITHNRETMSRAGVLYGITMGMDGVSRVLTVKLDDAVAVAK